MRADASACIFCGEIFTAFYRGFFCMLKMMIKTIIFDTALSGKEGWNV